jgi:hypothetical protein
MADGGWRMADGGWRMAPVRESAGVVVTRWLARAFGRSRQRHCRDCMTGSPGAHSAHAWQQLLDLPVCRAVACPALRIAAGFAERPSGAAPIVGACAGSPGQGRPGEPRRDRDVTSRRPVRVRACNRGPRQRRGARTRSDSVLQSSRGRIPHKRARDAQRQPAAIHQGRKPCQDAQRQRVATLSRATWRQRRVQPHPDVGTSRGASSRITSPML